MHSLLGVAPYYHIIYIQVNALYSCINNGLIYASYHMLRVTEHIRYWKWQSMSDWKWHNLSQTESDKVYYTESDLTYYIMKVTKYITLKVTKYITLKVTNLSHTESEKYILDWKWLNLLYNEGDKVYYTESDKMYHTERDTTYHTLKVRKKMRLKVI